MKGKEFAEFAESTHTQKVTLLEKRNGLCLIPKLDQQEFPMLLSDNEYCIGINTFDSRVNLTAYPFFTNYNLSRILNDFNS